MCVAVNDPTVAGADRVVTNYALGQAFAIQKSAFLANDTDPDTVLDVTAINSVNGLTASLATNPGAITITDTGTAGGSFVYAVGSTTATVAVVGDFTAGSIDGGNGNDIIVGNACR